MEKAIWQCSQPEQKVVLITIMLLANHIQNQWLWRGQKFKCEPGQFITSLKSLSEKAGVSVRSVRTAIDKFEKLEFLTSEATNEGRLITILNWDRYQHLYNQTDKQVDKPPTNHRQTTDKPPTTNKNDKNVKNEKNDIYIEQGHLLITWEDFNKLADEFGEVKADEYINKVLNYRKNSKYKSLYLTALNWLKRDTSEGNNKKPVLAR